MSQTRDNDKDVPTWNGAEETWNAYLEDVEWYFYALEPKHRGLLAHRLARKLTGTARNALKGLKASEFIGIEGITKLLRILQSRVGDLPVPDLANKLDEFIFKLKRKPGESMQEWGLRSCETYRKLTVALDRVKGRPSDIVIFDAGKSAERADEFPWPSEWDGQDQEQWQWPPEDQEGYDDGMSEAGSHHSTGVARTRRGKFGPRKQVNQPDPDHHRTPSNAPSKASKKSKPTSNDDDGFKDEDGFLPTEVRGWLLLRNSGLTYTERATVIASTQGKLEFSTIFRALRQQYPPRDLTKIDEQRSRGKRGGRGSIHAVSGLDSGTEGESDRESGEDIDVNTSLMHVDVGDDGEFAELQAMEAEALQTIATGQKTLAHARKAIAQAKLSRGFHPRKPLPVGFKANKRFDRSSKPMSSSFSKSSDQGCFICGGPHSFRTCPDRNAPKRSTGSSNLVFMLEAVETKEEERKVPLTDTDDDDMDTDQPDTRDRQGSKDEEEEPKETPEALLNLNYGHNIPAYQIQVGIDSRFRDILKVTREARHTDKLAIGFKISHRLVNLDQTLESVGIKTKRRPYEIYVVMASIPEEASKLKAFNELDQQGHLHSEPPFPPGLTFPADGRDADEHGLTSGEYKRQKAAKKVGLQAKAAGPPPPQRKVETAPIPISQNWNRPKWSGPILAKRKEKVRFETKEESESEGHEERAKGKREDGRSNRPQDEDRYDRRRGDQGKASSSRDPHGNESRDRDEDPRGKKPRAEPRKEKSSRKEEDTEKYIYEVMIFHANGRSTMNMIDFREAVWVTLHDITTEYDYLNYELKMPMTYTFDGIRLSSEEMHLKWGKIRRPNWKGPGDVLIMTTSKEASALMLEVFSATATATPSHLALVDSGASETVGSAESIEALVNHLTKTYGRPPNINIDPKKRQRFRVANGEVIEAKSLIGIETPIGTLQVHCITTEHPTPLLLSVSALKALKAAIDFEHGIMMINIHGRTKEVRLRRGDKGHYYVDFGEIGGEDQKDE